MFHVTISKLIAAQLIAALVVISAILAPAAVAQPVESSGIGSKSGIQARTGSGIPPTVESASSGGAASNGFDWGDAAVGAAGMLVALSVGAAGLITIRRSRGRSHPALTG
jgi:hypothetical protein